MTEVGATLNLTWSRQIEGEKSYSDGEIEEELLTRLRAGEAPEEILASDYRFPMLYHLSEDRQNVLSWYPFDPQASLMEIGAGPGAITGLFAQRVRRVVAVELTRRRAEINLARNGAFDNLEIMVANFSDITWQERFDYVTLIGVLEYAGSFCKGQNPYQTFLEQVRARLLPGGKLLLAIENRFGLKYWAGADEDHLGRPFAGLEGYSPEAGVQTFSRAGLERLLRSAGFTKMEFYLTLPDYKFPSEIIAEQAADLHQLARAIPNRMMDYEKRLFDEAAVQRALASDGLLPQFTNGFLVVAGQEEEAACASNM